MESLVSFDISSDFGFFKKPDINCFGLTYNIPPKPAILGIIGSVLGMNGLGKHYENVKEDLQSKGSSHSKGRNRAPENLSQRLQYPEYYQNLKHLKIGIKPIGESFPFNKIMNKYNSRNSYFGGGKYENILREEQLLIKPAYRIYVYDKTKKGVVDELSKRIKNNNPVFMPYLGKNEFIVTFDKYEAVEHAQPIKNTPSRISSIFLRTETDTPYGNNNHNVKKIDMHGESVAVNGLPGGFKFLEHYPIGYSKEMHYDLQVAEFTSRTNEAVAADLEKGDLLEIKGEIIYLF